MRLVENINKYTSYIITHTHTQPTETVLNNFEITKSVKNSSKIYKMQIDEKMGIKKTQ